MPRAGLQYAPSVKTVRDRTWPPCRHRAPGSRAHGPDRGFCRREGRSS